MEKDVREKFDGIDVKFKQVDARFDALFEYMQVQFTSIFERFDAFSERQGRAELRIEDTEDHIDSIEQAIDKDAMTIINHERRITRLEAA